MSRPTSPDPFADPFADPLSKGLDTDSGASDTRPVSVWPASTRPADLNSRSFAPTHFDPLLDQKFGAGARDRKSVV